MKTIYLDLNIFDRLEKLDALNPSEKAIYQPLHELLTNKRLISAYSNAHLNDLFRGYQKNPDYVEGHLANIQKLTHNLCICQYWGEKTVRWQYKDIFEFFKEKEEEWITQPNTFDDLFDGLPMYKSLLEMYKLQPLDPKFKNGYSEPIFGLMFPLSKTENTFYSLISDIYNFQSRLKTDYSLYKTFKKLFIENINKLKNRGELLKMLSTENQDLPKHLELGDILQEYEPENTFAGNNDLHAKIIDSFFKYDLAGYKTDGHFNNMFDDGLHTFYASHFDYFVTNDERCKYKALKTYNRLKIQTEVLNINDAKSLFSNTPS